MLALEAMARGRSVIAINQAAMPEIIENGVSGLLCDSAEWLGDQLATALQSPMISSTLGGAARIRVAERFSIGTCAQQIADEYRNACQ
jgi:starch synthase